jgi:hypothetical protein
MRDLTRFSRARALSLSLFLSISISLSLGHLLQEFVFAMTPLHNQARTPALPFPVLRGRGEGTFALTTAPPPPIGQAPTCPWEDTVRVFREEFDSHPDIMYQPPPAIGRPVPANAAAPQWRVSNGGIVVVVVVGGNQVC